MEQNLSAISLFSGAGGMDGGDLYNAVLNEVVSVMKTAFIGIIAEVVTSGGKTSAKAVAVAAANAIKSSAKK